MTLTVITYLKEKTVALTGDPEQFLNTYMLVLNKLWENDTEIARLRANPRRYAIEIGLPVDSDAEVRVDESAMDGLYTSSQLIEDWTGQVGVHVLHAPPAPTFDLAELSDMELESVNAGTGDVNVSLITTNNNNLPQVPRPPIN